MRLKRLILLGSTSFTAYSRDNGAQLAAAIAYHILFAIVPLVIFFMSALGLLIGTEQVQQRISDYISENFDLSTANVTLELSESGTENLEETYGPEAVAEVEAELDAMNDDPEREPERSALADDLLDEQSVEIAGYTVGPGDIDFHFDNIVIETIRSVVEASSTVSIISLLFLGYAASGLFGQVRRALDYVWGQPRRPPMVQGKLRDVALLIALFILLVLTLVLLFALSVAASILLRILSEVRTDPIFLERALWPATSLLVPLGFSFALFALLYRFGPRAKVHWGDVWLGALLAAVAFEALKFGFGIYVTNFSAFDVVYGALGGVLLFLMFVFFSAQAFLFGAEISAYYPRVRRGEFDEPEGPPKPPMSLREMAVSFVKGFFVTQPPP